MNTLMQHAAPPPPLSVNSSCRKISARLLKNSAHTIALSVTKLLNLSILKLVNFLNCGNVLKLQPCLSEGTGQMHQNTDLSLYILRKLSKILEKTVHPQL